MQNNAVDFKDTNINLMEVLLIAFYSGWEYGTNEKPSEEVAKRWIAKAVLDEGLLFETVDKD